jgi:hypothetical protein
MLVIIDEVIARTSSRYYLDLPMQPPTNFQVHDVNIINEDIHNPCMGLKNGLIFVIQNNVI